MDFKAIDIRESYRSDKGNIVDLFYLPTLSQSIEYCRAVGYFNSASLAKAAKGVTALIENGGKMKLIASPQLDDQDVEAFKKGYKQREEIIKRSILKEFEHVENEVVRKRLRFLAWLVAEELLDIRFALVKEGHGIYHEKIGILKDAEGNTIAFGGSPNETLGGIYSNFESIDVFRSWIKGEESRVHDKMGYFENLWNNRTQKLEIIDFSEASKREIFEQFKPENRPTGDPESSISNETITVMEEEKKYEKKSSKEIKIPDYIDLRPYQREAIANWFENNGQGVLKMATGTGKTITALSAATTLRGHLKKDGQPLTITVVCPYQHLVTQWDENAREFGYVPIKCFKSRHTWNKQLNSAITSVNAKVKDDLFIITTNSTFSGSEFQKLLSNLNQPLLFSVDEVHNLGSKKMRKQLPESAEFRLGLSATPERWYDDEGTQQLYEYFGKPVFEYGLKEAIENGYLTEYDYYPVQVPLTDEELTEYLQISEKITYMMASDEYDLEDEDGPLSRLLIKRARITANAQNKLSYLEDEIKKHNITDSTHNLIYCGDGRVDLETQEEEVRQIEAATRLLGNKLGMLNSSYVAETDTDERKKLLKNFAEGEIQALVAIRCLDEGVDVPQTRRAFILASSTNPRQFIQRRGRVLRKAEGKEKAEIWDFIVLPPFDAVQESSFSVERKLIEKELKRVIEFTKLAKNGAQAENMLLDIKKQYNLLHL